VPKSDYREEKMLVFAYIFKVERREEGEKEGGSQGGRGGRQCDLPD
jgi:hypothetical protein